MKHLPAVIIIVLILAGCGGGSGSSTNDEGAWTSEVQAVMKESEKTVGAAERQIDSATTRKSLEAAYRTYAARLSKVTSGLRDTDAPDTCSSVKSHLVAFLQEFGTITGELGHQSSLGQKQFDTLVREDTTAAQAFAGMMERIGSEGHC
jgi:hypothetical protein